MTLPATADFVVVGAGLVGMLAALELAGSGRKILVLEKSAFWREGSAVNAGTLALQNKPTELLGSYRQALGLWDRLADRLGAPLGRMVRGGLRLAETEAECAELADAVARQNAAGVGVELVSGNRLRMLAPWLGRSVTAASFCAEDGFANPLLTGEALLHAARDAGVHLAPSTPLQAACRDGAGWRLATAGGAISCSGVLIAAGPWSGEVAALFGAPLSIGLHVNMLSATQRIAPVTQGLVVTHIAGRLTLKQFPNGTFLLGGGWQGIGDLDSGRKELDFSQLRANLALHCRVVPLLGQAPLLRSWTGFTAAPADGLPAIGPLPGAPGVAVAVTTGAGFTLGPLAAQMAAHAVLHGGPAPGSERFLPARLVHAGAGAAIPA